MKRKFLTGFKVKISVWILILLYGGLVGAEFLSPYTQRSITDGHVYHPPNVRLYSKELGFRPQIQHYIQVDVLSRRWVALKGQYEAIHFFSKGESYKLWKVFPLSTHFFTTNEYPVYLMGADYLGRDLFSRILYGSRISLTIGLIGILIAVPIGFLLGGIAGYHGGGVDWIIMRLCEFIILIPGLYLLLFLRSVFLPLATPSQTFLIISLILSVIGFPGTARMVRGIFHSLKREDFILAAQLDGIPVMVIIVRHMLPHLSSILLISISMSIPAFILGETALSFLGLGITDPSVSWGSLLNSRILNISVIRAHPWVLYPGLFLILTTLAYNFIGERLRDMLDPHHTGAIK